MKNMKQKIIHELVEVGGVMVYLALVFLVLQTFKCTTLLVACSENDFLASYITALLAAVGLGKFVFVRPSSLEHITDPLKFWLCVASHELAFFVTFFIFFCFRDMSRVIGEAETFRLFFVERYIKVIYSHCLAFLSYFVNPALVAGGANSWHVIAPA